METLEIKYAHYGSH